MAEIENELRVNMLSNACQFGRLEEANQQGKLDSKLGKCGEDKFVEKGNCRLGLWGT